MVQKSEEYKPDFSSQTLTQLERNLPYATQKMDPPIPLQTEPSITAKVTIPSDTLSKVAMYPEMIQIVNDNDVI